MKIYIKFSSLYFNFSDVLKYIGPVLVVEDREVVVKKQSNAFHLQTKL